MSARDLSDPILLELVKNGLDAIVDEMAIALVRTAYSNNLKNAMDMSCALCDADGRLIAQGLTLPLHLGSIPDAMAHVRRKFGASLEPGDVFILNDPFEGGTHLPDFYIFKPIFVDRRLVGWSASIGHQLDVGGKTPGGNGCDATEIFQEGLRIPPLRLYAAGKPVDAVFELIDRNVRVPRQVLGDVRSQVAACLTGERGYLKLAEQYGAERFAACTTALLDQAERLARNAITAMPDGRYTFTDWMDDDGIDPDPIPITVAITVDRRPPHRRLHRLGAAGEGRHQLAAAVHQVRRLCVRAPPDRRRSAEQRGLLPPDRGDRAAGHRRQSRHARRRRRARPHRLPHRQRGVRRPRPDRARSGLRLRGGRRHRRELRRLRRGAPAVRLPRVPLRLLGRPPDQGRRGRVQQLRRELLQQPVEVIESEYPLMIERYGYLPDTGGPGKFRGGLALERQYRFLEAEGTLQLRTDRRHHCPTAWPAGARARRRATS